MDNIKNLDNSSKYIEMKKYYSYLYDLGDAMFAYYDSRSLLSGEQIDLIVNSSDEDKITGMYLAACDRQKISYNYTTFTKNNYSIKIAKINRKK